LFSDSNPGPSGHKQRTTLLLCKYSPSQKNGQIENFSIYPFLIDINIEVLDSKLGS